MFCGHTKPEEFEDAKIIIGHFGFVFEENSRREITSFLRCGLFRQTPFSMSVDVTPNRKTVFLNFCGVICTGPKMESSLRIHQSEDIYALLTEREMKIWYH